MYVSSSVNVDSKTGTGGGMGISGGSLNPNLCDSEGFQKSINNIWTRSPFSFVLESRDQEGQRNIFFWEREGEFLGRDEIKCWPRLKGKKAKESYTELHDLDWDFWEEFCLGFKKREFIRFLFPHLRPLSSLDFFWDRYVIVRRGEWERERERERESSAQKKRTETSWRGKEKLTTFLCTLHFSLGLYVQNSLSAEAEGDR